MIKLYAYHEYETYLYHFQQALSNLVNLNTDINILLCCLLIFLAGVLTSLNPCFLSILPISLSYLNIKKLKSQNKNYFILGIFTSFIILLFISHIISYRYRFILSKIPIISSLISICLGLNFLQIIDFTRLYTFFSSNFKLSTTSSSISEDYFAGFLCSLTTLPCSSPVVFTIIFWLSHADSFLVSFSYLLIYLCGIFISIFLLITFMYKSISSRIIIKFWNVLYPVSGFIILFNGTLSLVENILN